MTQLNISAVLTACDFVASKIVTIEGEYHGSTWLFNQCMRAFDHKALPAEALTFSVFLNAPVMANGEATIHRDGRTEIRLA